MLKDALVLCLSNCARKGDNRYLINSSKASQRVLKIVGACCGFDLILGF